MSPRSRGRGFTLAELMLSLGLVAVMALTLVALSFTSIASRQKAEDFTAAVLVAEEQLASVVRRIEILSAAEHSAFWDTSPSGPQAAGVVSMGGTDYNYSVEASEQPTGTTEPNRMRKLDVTVWWWSAQSGQSRTGFGRLQYGASRLVREIKNEVS